jgi:hypothetical protein
MKGGVVDTNSFLRERIFHPLPKNADLDENRNIWEQLANKEKTADDVFSLQEIVQLHIEQ